MSDRNLPDIRPGKSLLGIPASEWQTLIRDVRALRNLSAGPGIKVIKNDAGYVISALPQAKGGGAAGSVVAIKTVIIVQPVGDNDKTLTVLEVAYADSPPEPPTPVNPSTDGSYFTIIGEEFKAYPYLGKRAFDYRDLVYQAGETVPVPIVFDARLIDEDVWMLSAPATVAGTGGVRVARVLGSQPSSDDSSDFLLVQPVITDIGGTGRFEVAEGLQEVVLTWPGLLAGDFRPFALFPVYVLLVKTGDNWVAMQTIPWNLDGASDATSIATDACGP